ncbi:MAG: hypothetical protein UW46_C0002G0044 [Candidatus Yanofskybacteria bacterium GW2011_GWF1_44_227]|uniref:Membrane protein insertion efficiency factor n=1 Tax=Candidatus Yanofskybacteria bacterium GW2011_GWE2_40_11 TaxID=1619033 RepID=A0A0G0QTJ2_9BACT|nr:MAG: hypothetical protein UT69_C0004G0018 [Candidatus Yanofskybacteria bacterium GW2011_GWE1_40_10]KKR40641.1 MAG: hypothetical protein UT75_C0006G0020 [Candidatus Yanofskybacteria bacterium GW2011_GWE2_40_11]KKT15798.1 MAG: hypothetical protein UV97_C0002G0044 [Candidatus Yanofskybacteria bacterium GW2011_GWF2_43_596]KKT53488.1 MAG: hypothetical protein UW46_C0002G0044 [Candidatus Yanofskybacteria bacterium GW2011_GWF1_44_227]HAU07611.1 membrane protein insertion efficiency factor YidD [Can
MSKAIVALINFYRKINRYWSVVPIPFAVAGCKFHPSCSEYAILAIEKDGALSGVARALKRIIRCNPLSSGGVDLP